MDDNTKQFAQDCADFFKKKLFTPDVQSTDLGLRIDAVVYLMAQGFVHGPSIEDMVMGTKGPTGGPHFGLLLDFLRGANLPEDFIKNMPSVGRY